MCFYPFFSVNLNEVLVYIVIIIIIQIFKEESLSHSKVLFMRVLYLTVAIYLKHYNYIFPNSKRIALS